jgi:Arc/MetJ family transcription regulator
MKTTVDLPESELAEALRHTGAKTKTEAVSLAVADFNRRQRLARLAEKMGTFTDLITGEDLKNARKRS